MSNLNSTPPFFQNLLTKDQSLHLLNTFDVAREDAVLPKGKGILFIIFPKSRTDVSSIEITVSPNKSTYKKTLYHWKHFRVDTPVLEPTLSGS